MKDQDLQVRPMTDLTDYKPERGVKAIAVAEAAERHYRRAKNSEKLIQAVTHKLTEQRHFVLWWDQQVKSAGGRGTGANQYQKKLVGLQSDNPTLKKWGLEKTIVHRWRVRLAESAAFETAMQTATDKCIRICEQTNRTAEELIIASNENEWYTPKLYLDAARDVLGTIDLDPASSPLANRVVRAKQFYTAEAESLSQPWPGCVWLNPPYGRLAGDFVQHALEEYHAKRLVAVVILLNAHCTDTDWFQPLWDGLLCFTNHRIEFDSAGRPKDPTSSSTHGSVFVYFGPERKTFAERFGAFGAIVARWEP